MIARVQEVFSIGGHPWHRSPMLLLVLMSFALPLAFSAWVALLNNFAHNEAGFNGSDIGWLQSVREIPGFAAFLVVFVIIIIREQRLALLSLILLGGFVAIVGDFPTFWGLLLTTFFSSIGFHYYETVKMSLELQWLPADRAPILLGWLIAIGSASSLIVYLVIIALWEGFGWDYSGLYRLFGGLTILIAVYCWCAFPLFKQPVAQRTEIVLKWRYWLYYALQFMAGARRQIFVVFAAFMMVERFYFDVHQVTALFLVNFVANMIFAPIMGRVVQRFGERAALCFEYAGLFCVFALYAGIYIFNWGVVFAATLYILDHFFFALALGIKTYFQKIADPEDIAPTTSVAFTINHIGAVGLPAALGYLWLINPQAVFWFAAALAAASFVLSLMIPRHPGKGNETIFRQPSAVAAE
ncbi:MAG: MFS transporter [Pseudomonadota bacterium]